MALVTSVPQWDGEPAVVDPSARSLCLVGVGSDGIELVRRWRDAADAPFRRLTADELDAGFLDRFRATLAAAVVGWRLMMAGPEPAVAQLLAEAVGAGAEESEIRTTVTPSGRRRTYCAHCALITEAQVACGGVLRCPGCARLLTVRPHYSPRLAAYLGVVDVS